MLCEMCVYMPVVYIDDSKPKKMSKIGAKLNSNLKTPNECGGAECASNILICKK